jgi:hypothetical protein
MQMSLDLNEITDETLQAIQKAATAGVISSTGLVGFDLSGVVSLVPVNTPTYDTPRTGVRCSTSTARSPTRSRAWTAAVR